jgi:hypothetical protein
MQTGVIVNRGTRGIFGADKDEVRGVNYIRGSFVTRTLR